MCFILLIVFVFGTLYLCFLLLDDLVVNIKLFFSCCVYFMIFILTDGVGLSVIGKQTSERIRFW
jgi:hypothetical protein